MKNIKRFLGSRLPLLASVAFLMTACGEEPHQWDTVLFEPGTMEATASATEIQWGESITYTDNSTKVHSRSWVFQGGTPATSTEASVVVNYPVGGSYNAILEVVYVDNSRGQEVFNIEVERDPTTIVPEYDYGTTLGLYTENPDMTASIPGYVVQNMNQFAHETTTMAYEGAEALVFSASGTSDWAMGGIRNSGDLEQTDISAFENGYYHVALKTESLADMLIRIRSTGGGNVIFEVTVSEDGVVETSEGFAFPRDGEWHMISIPVSRIKERDFNQTLNLSEITEFLLFRSHNGDVRNFAPYVWYVDNIFMSEKMELIE